VAQVADVVMATLPRNYDSWIDKLVNNLRVKRSGVAFRSIAS
jgi:hypothetical protein